MSRPTVLEIDLSALSHNLAEVRRKVGERAILAMVKADAYGHGVKGVAHHLSTLGVRHWGVHSTEEALQLRREKIPGMILILGGVYAEDIALLLQEDLTPCVHSLENFLMLEEGLAAQKKPKDLAFHLKIDSGMGRLGILPAQLPDFCQRLKNSKHLKLAGTFTHLATSDDRLATAKQNEVFAQCLKVMEEAGVSPGLRHVSNSFASVFYPETQYDLVRPGIILYGHYSSPVLAHLVQLKPLATFATRIVSIREFPTGTGISYAHTFVTQRPTRVATLPAGYADGYPRGLGNRGRVLVVDRNGQSALVPVIGRVCMDLMMIDVTDVKLAAVGDRVVLFGKPPAPSVEEIGDLMQTIAYEILCGISPRVPRLEMNTQGGM